MTNPNPSIDRAALEADSSACASDWAEMVAKWNEITSSHPPLLVAAVVGFVFLWIVFSLWLGTKIAPTMPRWLTAFAYGTMIFSISVTLFIQLF